MQDIGDPNQHESTTPTDTRDGDGNGTSVVVAEETEDLGDRFDRLLCFIPIRIASCIVHSCRPKPEPDPDPTPAPALVEVRGGGLEEAPATHMLLVQQ